MAKNKINRTNQKSTYYPFYYLSSSSLWNTNIILEKGETPKRKHATGKIGKFNEDMFQYLVNNPKEIYQLIDLILEVFWEARVKENVKRSLQLPVN